MASLVLPVQVAHFVADDCRPWHTALREVLFYTASWTIWKRSWTALDSLPDDACTQLFEYATDSGKPLNQLLFITPFNWALRVARAATYEVKDGRGIVISIQDVDHCWRELAAIPDLKEVHLRALQGDLSSSVNYLASFRMLRTLHLDGAVDPNCAEAIRATLRALPHGQLQDFAMPSANLEQAVQPVWEGIASLRHLTRLQLCTSFLRDLHFAPRLAALHALQVLDLGNSELDKCLEDCPSVGAGDDEVSALAGSIAALPELSEFKLHFDKAESDCGFADLCAALANRPKLTVLVLRGGDCGNHMMEPLAECLATLPNVAQVEVTSCLLSPTASIRGGDGFRALMQRLSALTTLKQLKLADIVLERTDEQDVSALVAALPALKALTHLSLGIFFHASFAPALGTAIGACARLEQLDLACGCDEWQGVHQALSHLSALANLTLHICDGGVARPLCSERAVTLAQSFSRLQALRVLDLGINWLGVTGMSAVCAALGTLTGLSSLRLTNVGLDSSQGSAAVAGVFRQLPASSLSELVIDGNDLGPVGVAAAASALGALTALTRLTLRGVSAGASGVGALASHLTGLARLKTLNLEDNGVALDSDAGKLLAASLQEYIDRGLELAIS